MSVANYLKESYLEFKEQVEWPKWLDLQSSTIVVTIATAILGIFTFGIDEVFALSIRNMITTLSSVFN